VPMAFTASESHRADYWQKPYIAMLRYFLTSSIIWALTVLGFLTLALAADRQPMEVLRDGLNQGLALLNDESYRGANSRTAQEMRLRELTMTLFDFTTMSHMVVSSHWRNFTSAQQSAFIRAFTAFLQRTYLPMLLDQYDGEQIVYVRQIMISNLRARVEVRVLHHMKTIPVNVKMICRDGRWRIYDVDVLGFSALRIYRTQLDGLLRRKRPGLVIELLQQMGKRPP